MNESIEIEPVQNNLPAEIDLLIKDSLDDGVRSMLKLQRSWRSGEERFDKDGAALFAAFYNGTLVGVCGLTPQKGQIFNAMRMRRLYVLRKFRRKNIARRLALQTMHSGLEACDALTCNAQASEAAPLFWESVGFVPVDLPDITHMYHRPNFRSNLREEKHVVRS